MLSVAALLLHRPARTRDRALLEVDFTTMLFLHQLLLAVRASRLRSFRSRLLRSRRTVHDTGNRAAVLRRLPPRSSSSSCSLRLRLRRPPSHPGLWDTHCLSVCPQGGSITARRWHQRARHSVTDGARSLVVALTASAVRFGAVALFHLSTLGTAGSVRWPAVPPAHLPRSPCIFTVIIGSLVFPLYFCLLVSLQRACRPCSESGSSSPSSSGARLLQDLTRWRPML
jgi:hypothetical protein